MTGNQYLEEEAAPLLSDDNLNGDVQTDGDLKSASSSSQRSPIKQRLLFLWHWLRHNVKILALTALLFGGVIALVVFIARKSWISSHRRQRSILGYLLFNPRWLRRHTPRLHALVFDSFESIARHTCHPIPVVDGIGSGMVRHYLA